MVEPFFDTFPPQTVSGFAGDEPDTSPERTMKKASPGSPSLMTSVATRIVSRTGFISRLNVVNHGKPNERTMPGNGFWQISIVVLGIAYDWV